MSDSYLWRSPAIRVPHRDEQAG